MATYIVECGFCGNEASGPSVWHIDDFVERCEFCCDDMCSNCKAEHEKCKEESEIEDKSND